MEYLFCKELKQAVEEKKLHIPVAVFSNKGNKQTYLDKDEIEVFQCGVRAFQKYKNE